MALSLELQIETACPWVLALCLAAERVSNDVLQMDYLSSLRRWPLRPTRHCLSAGAMMDGATLEISKLPQDHSSMISAGLASVQLLDACSHASEVISPEPAWRMCGLSFLDLNFQFLIDEQL